MFKPIGSTHLMGRTRETPRGNEFKHEGATSLLLLCVWSIVCFTAGSTWRTQLWWCMIVISEAAHSVKCGPWLIFPCTGATDSRQDDDFSSPSLYTGNFHVVNRGIDSGLRPVCPWLSLSSGEKTFAEACVSFTWCGEPSKQYCDALNYNLCIYTFILTLQNDIF